MILSIGYCRTSRSPTAAKFSYVQTNFEELKLLPGAENNVLVNAHLLVSLLDNAVDVAVTNCADQGVLFAEGRWVPFTPLPVMQVVDETGAGDGFGAAWTLARAVFGLDVEDALCYSREGMG